MVFVASSQHKISPVEYVITYRYLRWLEVKKRPASLDDCLSFAPDGEISTQVALEQWPGKVCEIEFWCIPCIVMYTSWHVCIYIYIYIYYMIDIYIYIIWYDIVIYMWYSKQPGKKTWYVTKKTFVFCHWHGSLWIIPTSMALPVLQTCWFHLQQTVLDCKPGWWLFCLFLHVFAGCVPFIAGFELVCLPELLTKSD